MAKHRDVTEDDEPVAPVQHTGSLTGGLANPDDYKTTQTLSGPDPVDPPVGFDPPPPPLGIAPDHPYPEGNPPPDPHEPPPDEEVTFKASDKPVSRDPREPYPTGNPPPDPHTPRPSKGK